MSTASSLDREVACTASAVLPQARSSGAAAESGNATHAFVEEARARAEVLVGAGVAKVTYEEALAQAREELLAAIPDDADHKPLCEAIDLAQIPRGAESEVTLAWDPATGAARILGKNLGRDYSAARPGELVGTADLLGKIGDQVFVADLKTGKAVRGGASGTWQLRFLALAAARVVGAGGAIVQLVYPRADGRAYVDRAEFDALDLAGFARELRALLGRIERVRGEVEAGKVPDVTEGPWCRYCPALPSCPAKRDLIVQLVKRAEAAPTEEMVRAQVAALAPAEVGEAYARLEAAKLFLKRLEEAIDTYARQAGKVPLPDGRVLQEVVSVRRYLDGKVAADVLLALDEAQPEEKRIALDAIEYTADVSAASIRRALLKHGRKAKEADKVLEEIGKHNGFIKKVSAPMKAVKPGEVEIPNAEDTNQRARRASGG